MAKEENIVLDNNITSTEEMAEQAVKTPHKKTKEVVEEKQLVNCLRNERIIIRFLPKQNDRITNPKHVLFGGMAEDATRSYVVPKLESGKYVNVLTDDEKDYLEEIMGLEKNALSIYNKKDNFWNETNPNGISRVTLRKQDNYLDLSNPEDYIRYKILLANKDTIAPSLKAYEDFPKVTYQYVIISEGEETSSAKNGMNTVMQCYTLYGKFEDNTDVLRTIIEIMTGKRLSSTTKKEFMQVQINELIQRNSKMFLKIANDPLLKTKALIKKAVDSGVIALRGNQYYIREGNIPMCEGGEPTLNVAAQWLNLPKMQEMKFSIEAKLK